MVVSFTKSYRYKLIQLFLFPSVQIHFNNSTIDLPVCLSLQQKTFPNDTLTNQFYTGNTWIDLLHFASCALKTISANAFNIRTLSNLTTLYFLRMPSITFQLGAFNGLDRLDELQLIDVNIKNLNYMVFQPLALSLKELKLAQINELVNMYNIIGSIEYANVHTVLLSESKFYRILAPNSLTKLPKVRFINVYACGTEAILTGAFDHLNNTLERLFLYHNKLKTLPLNVFGKFGPAFIRKLDVAYNPWQCDCNIIELITMYGNIFRISCQTKDLHWYRANCTEEQMANERRPTKDRNCLYHYGTNAIRINCTATYHIRITDNGTKLQLRISKRTYFYILIVTAANHEMHCISIAAKYVSLSLNSLYVPPGLRSVVIIDPANNNRTISPMHFVSFYVQPNNIWFHANARVPIVSVLVLNYMAAFIFGTLFGIVLVRKHLILLQGLDRVIFTHDKITNEIDTVLVMPDTWPPSVPAQGASVSCNVGSENNYIEFVRFGSRRFVEDQEYEEAIESPVYEHIK